MTPHDHALTCGLLLDTLASDMLALADLARTLSPRGGHEALVHAGRGNAMRALRAWDAACIAEVGADRRLRLPVLRVGEVLASPAQLAAIVARAESPRVVDEMADGCRWWAREYRVMRDGPVAA